MLDGRDKSIWVKNKIISEKKKCTIYYHNTKNKAKRDSLTR